MEKPAIVLRVSKAIQRRNYIAFSNKWYWNNYKPIYKENKITSIITSCHVKLNIKWIINLNQKLELML